MAFCIRSERKMDYIKSANIILGPGYYFKETDKNYIKKRIHPPFQISSQRVSLYQTNDNPGPGSYELNDKSHNNNKDSTYHSTKNITKKKEKNLSTINNNLSSIIFNSKSRNNNNSSGLLEISKTTSIKNNKSNIGISDNNYTENYINIKNNSNIKINNNLSLQKFEKIEEKISNLPDINKITKEFNLDIHDLKSRNNNKLKINLNKAKNKLISLPLKIETGSLKRIVSIQSKDMNGYTLDFNKTLNLLIEKTNTPEYIGPGRYNINIPHKPKSILEWSKTLNLKEIKHKKDTEKRKETLEELKRKGDIRPKLSKLKIRNKKKYSLIKKHWISGNTKKGLNDLNSKLFANNINKKSNLFIYSRANFISSKNEVPGPGYYTRDIIHKNVNKRNKENNLSVNEGGFGSSCDRFFYKSRTMQDLGPTTYFIEKNKFEGNKKPDIFSHLKNKSIVDDMVKSIIKLNDSDKNNYIPGPGSYELSHSFINKSFGKTRSMDNNIIRFKYEINDNPGPGTYTKNNNMNDIKKNIPIKKLVNITNKEEQEKRLKRLENIRKENNMGVPPVGTYNVENIDTINYKIQKKYNPKLSFNSPFLMSSGRFNQIYEKVDSPVYDHKYVKKNIKYMAFSRAQRFDYSIYKNNSAYFIGPGSYNLNKDEQWNKKTFNKLFSS